MTTTFALVALFSWPLVVFFLFRRLPKSEALIWSILGGYLALPFGVGINPPVLPTLDKTLIPALAAAVMCLLTPSEPPDAEHRAPARAAKPDRPPRSAPARGPRATAQAGTRAEIAAASPYARQPVPAAPEAAAPGAAATAWWRPKDGWILTLLLALLLFSPFVTYATNTAPQVIGPRSLQGLKLYDAFSMGLRELVGVLPFVLGRRYLCRPQDQVTLLRLLAIAGLVYSLPVLYEARMSPQLARDVYGFLAQKFGQAARDGGWRPVVFLQHGLWLAIFMAMTVLAAFALWRHERARGMKTRWLLAGFYLAIVLVLCNSLGALAEMLLLAPLVLLFSVRIQLLAASAVALIIITYPVLRGTGVIPVDTIHAFVSNNISAARAQSLDFRLQNEDELLALANEHPLAGWGGYGRSRVHNDKGQGTSTTDGMWVIVIGTSGWLGYVSKFGLLAAPILLMTLRRRKLDPALASTGLCLILTANLIDMIPNATLTPVTWLVAGALAGRYGHGARAEPDVQPADRRLGAQAARPGVAGARPT